VKNLFSILLTLGMATACQPATNTPATPATLLPAQSRLAKKQPAAIVLPKIRLAATDSLSVAMRTFARRHDLSATWQGLDDNNGDNHEMPSVLNGFLGPDYCRIELILLGISRDSADPLLYHAHGKSRYKQRITSFVGAIRLQRLRQVSIQNFVDELQGEFARFYTARGEFQFQEIRTVSPGTFAGTIGIDFQQKADSSLAVTYFWGDEHKQYARGDKLYLKGQWSATQTTQRKEFVAGVNPADAGREIIPDFDIGEHGFTLNPKYAKLGWEDYWKNEEWWVEAPRPRLHP
jgi:hypothetical protein